MKNWMIWLLIPVFLYGIYQLTRPDESLSPGDASIEDLSLNQTHDSTSLEQKDSNMEESAPPQVQSSNSIVSFLGSMGMGMMLGSLMSKVGFQNPFKKSNDGISNKSPLNKTTPVESVASKKSAVDKNSNSGSRPAVKTAPKRRFKVGRKLGRRLRGGMGRGRRR